MSLWTKEPQTEQSRFSCSQAQAPSLFTDRLLTCVTIKSRAHQLFSRHPFSWGRSVRIGGILDGRFHDYGIRFFNGHRGRGNVRFPFGSKKAMVPPRMIMIGIQCWKSWGSWCASVNVGVILTQPRARVVFSYSKLCHCGSNTRIQQNMDDLYMCLASLRGFVPVKNSRLLAGFYIRFPKAHLISFLAIPFNVELLSTVIGRKT